MPRETQVREEVVSGVSENDDVAQRSKHCRTFLVKDAHGTVKELVFPKALDLDRPKRERTTFSSHQLNGLEEIFKHNQYLVGKDRTAVAKRLGLTETQVKVWFQNRRTKHKKDSERFHDINDTSAESKAAQNVLKLLEYSTALSFNNVQSKSPEKPTSSEARHLDRMDFAPQAECSAAVEGNPSPKNMCNVSASSKITPEDNSWRWTIHPTFQNQVDLSSERSLTNLHSHRVLLNSSITDGNYPRYHTRSSIDSPNSNERDYRHVISPYMSYQNPTVTEVLCHPLPHYHDPLTAFGQMIRNHDGVDSPILQGSRLKNEARGCHQSLSGGDEQHQTLRRVFPGNPLVPWNDPNDKINAVYTLDKNIAGGNSVTSNSGAFLTSSEENRTPLITCSSSASRSSIKLGDGEIITLKDLEPRQETVTSPSYAPSSVPEIGVNRHGCSDLNVMQYSLRDQSYNTNLNCAHPQGKLNVPYQTSPQLHYPLHSKPDHIYSSSNVICNSSKPRESFFGSGQSSQNLIFGERFATERPPGTSLTLPCWAGSPPRMSSPCDSPLQSINSGLLRGYFVNSTWAVTLPQYVNSNSKKGEV